MFNFMFIWDTSVISSPCLSVYDIDDLLLVKKHKTIVIFVSDGKVKFAASESEYANKIAQLGFSADKLQVIKETFESLNSFDILRKLSKLRYDSDTFLVNIFFWGDFKISLNISLLRCISQKLREHNFPNLPL